MPIPLYIQHLKRLKILPSTMFPPFLSPSEKSYQEITFPFLNPFFRFEKGFLSGSLHRKTKVYRENCILMAYQLFQLGDDVASQDMYFYII